MKISLPSWLLKQPQETTVPELEAQLEAAHQAHDDAQAAVKDAAAAFDLDPKQEQAVLDAQDQLRRTAAHVERAQRLLKAGQAREAEHLRAEREVSEALLSEQLQARSLAARNQDQKVADALLEVARAQAERLVESRKLKELARELARVQVELTGMEYADLHDALERALPPTWIGTAFEKFRQKFSTFAEGDPVRDAAIELLGHKK